MLDQLKTEKLLYLKSPTPNPNLAKSGDLNDSKEMNLSKSNPFSIIGLESNSSILSVRLRFFWSKKTFFQNQLKYINETLEGNHKELEFLDVLQSKLKSPFSLVINGYLDIIKDNDLLDMPKGKEDIIEKKRLTVFPKKQIEIKERNNCLLYANKIDKAINSAFSKYFIYINNRH